MKILETERLIIQLLSIDDAAFILTLLNSPGWLQFIGNKNVHTIEDAQNYILNGPLKSYKQQGFGLYLMNLKNGNERIGICGLIKRETLKDADLGFALLPEFQGRGYVAEAAAAILNYAHSNLKLNRIAAITQPDNLACIKLLESLGFVFKNKISSPGEDELMLYGIKL